MEKEYKNSTTTFVIRNIPVDTWKTFKKVCIMKDFGSANDALLSFISENSDLSSWSK